MRYSLASAAILSAITIGEVVAGPTHHMHRHLHDKKDILNVEKRDDTVIATINGEIVSWINNYFGPGQQAASPATSAPTVQTAAAQVTSTPASTTAAASVPATTTEASSPLESAFDSLGDDLKELWNDLVGFSNSRTSFGGKTSASGSTGDNYYGNAGSPYGSNIIKVASREGYAYTNEFINTSGQTMTVVIWNKIGSDGQVLSGSALAPKNTALTFALAPGASQIVAFDEDSQVGWAEAVSDFAPSGAFAITWGEANFVSTGSGYDVSAIMNPNGNNYNMSISSVEAQECSSTMTENMWLTATEPVGSSDGSCFVAQSTATLTTIMGGTV